MLLVQERLAELWTIQQNQRELSEAEVLEIGHCLRVNADYVRKISELYNVSLLASMTSDMEWQLEICGQIDAVEAEYTIKKPTTRGR